MGGIRQGALADLRKDKNYEAQDLGKPYDLVRAASGGCSASFTRMDIAAFAYAGLSHASLITSLP